MTWLKSDIGQRTIGAFTGLGLSISQQLISRAGGSINVTSEVGIGTCFSIWLPRAEIEE